MIQKCAPTWLDPAREHLDDLLRYGPREPRQHISRGNGDRIRSERESVRRARTAIRRWCVHNKVDRGLTLTCRPEEMVYDIKEAWALIDTFRRNLKEAGMDCVLLVPELCKGGQYHFHGAFPGWLDVKVLERAWGHGFVLIKKPKVPKGTSLRSRSRVLAGYLSKYLGKDFGGATAAPAETAPTGVAPMACPTAFNGKRYSTSRGTAVRKVHRRCSSMFNAYDAACAALGVTSIEMVWSSADADDWSGPPTSIWLEGG